MSGVVYLYGFVPADAPAPPDDAPGIAGSRVDFVELDGFRAAVSQIPGDPYGTERLQERLADLGWVGEHGAQHERVVTWLSDNTTIAPARLFTIFSSDAALREEARARGGEIRERLERFRDVREWDLKVSFDAEVLTTHAAEYSEEVADLDRRIADAAPGRRYLLQRRRDDTAGRAVADVAARQARRCLEDLAAMAERVAEQEITAGRGETPVVLRAALLVRSERAEAVRTTAARAAEHLAGRGIHVSLTGPWAPYRFFGDESHG